MKRFAILLSLTAFAALGATACAKDKQDSDKANTAADTTDKAAAKNTKVAATATKPDAEAAKLLVLKFHHDS